MTEIFNAPVIPNPMPGEDAETFIRQTLLPMLRQTFGRLETLSEVRDQPYPQKYNVSNLTVSRTFDCNGTSLSATNDVLGTLLQDLQTKSVLTGTAT